MRTISLSALFGLIVTATSLHSVELYSLKDLGTVSNLPGRDEGGSKQISRNGKIAAVNVTNDAYRAFIFAGAWTNLGTLGGNESLASGINASGLVAGSSLTGNAVMHAFLWTPGGTDGIAANPQMKDLGAPFGDAPSEATAINGSGQITGYLHRDGDDRAFRYTAGTLADIGVLLGKTLPNSYGMAINNAGHVVGLAYNKSFSSCHAFFYDGSTMVEIGRAEDDGTSAMAINDHDHIAGYLTTAQGFDHVFHYVAGTMTDLGTLGGQYAYGIAINNSNVIVGGSFIDAADTVYHAFMTRGNRLIDLHECIDASGAGWTLMEARAINDLGQIAGIGTYGGKLHNFLLNPPPVMTGVKPSSANVQVSFQTAGSMRYNLEGCGDVAGGEWAVIATGIKGNGETVTVTDSAALALPRRFYRARLILP